jgi:hypothetical protein
MQDVLRDLYDKKAKEWSFESMADMLTTAHTEIIAIAIRKPEAFGKECIATLKEVQKMIFPIEKTTKTAKQRIPAGDSREIVLKRIEDRLEEKK